MKKHDYVIITFFTLIFLTILYQRKIMPMMNRGSSSGSESGRESMTSSDSSGSEKVNTEGKKAQKSQNKLEKLFSEFEASLGLVDPSSEAEVRSQEIKPPSGVNRTSYYENGKFKSSYGGPQLPQQFLTKKEFFTDPSKLKEDMNFKMDKMSWDMENERNEFARTHDIRGKDKEEWNKLQENHRKMRKRVWEQNFQTWQELKRETYDIQNSELR